jgi:XisI protein
VNWRLLEPLPSLPIAPSTPKQECWDVSRRIHGPVVSLEIIDWKVWRQADNADLRIAERLEEAGIPKSDIALGFQPPHVRPYTEYAVA